MRVMGFSRKWQKLQQPEFTTFRYERADRDWGLTEVVQIVFKLRSKEREILGIAQIRNKELRTINTTTEAEARADGFDYTVLLWHFLMEDKRYLKKPINKLTLKWLDRR